MNHNFPPQNNGNPFQQPPQPQPPKSNNTALLAIIAVLAVIIVAGGAFFFIQSQDDEDSSTHAAEASETSKTEDTDEPSGSASTFEIGTCFSPSVLTPNGPITTDDIVDCSSPEGTIMLAEKVTENDPASCVDIPGAINVVEDFFDRDDKVAYCLVDREIDAEEAINLADIGDCVSTARTENRPPMVVDCDDSSAVRITSVTDDAPQGIEEFRRSGNPISEKNYTKFCEEHGTPNPVGYFTLEFTVFEKDTRTWCFSA